MTNDEIQNIFFLECEEALGNAEEGLMACRSGTADNDTVNSIFRAVHSIKGGAGAFSFTALQAFTHKFETVLSYVRDGELPLSEGLNTLMLRAFDVLADHVGAVRGLGNAPDDAAISAELETVADAAASGGPVEFADAKADEVPPADVSEPVDDLGLDFDIDGLLGDLEIPEEAEAPAAVELDTTPVEAANTGWLVTVTPCDGALANGSEPLLMLRELHELGGRCISVDARKLPQIDALDAEKAYLSWQYVLPAEVEKSAIEDVFDFVGPDITLTIDPLTSEANCRLLDVELPDYPVVEAAPVAEPVTEEFTPAASPAAVVTAIAKPAAAPVVPEAASAFNAAPPPRAVVPGQTVRVDLAKLDKLIDTVGELVIAQAMMAQRLANHGLTAIDEMGMLDLLTRDIQESTMSIRAQPIGSVFSRVPRIVRELEADTGKRVILTMSGESTELDKTVVERLGEPLTHLIRNAVDHGIEKPEVRVANGKPAEGKLHLSAEQRSGRIIISISDDGAGINREVVLKKAIERGLVAPGAQLSNEDIDNLIFAAGFSTAEKVSNISGRGVGMDVVRQNVKDLGGRISIESRPGEGCTFTLALPLTLAIADGMIVTVGDQTVVIPLTYVLESLRPAEAEVQFIGNNLMVLNNRGKFLPIVRLDHAVGALGAAESAQDAVLIVVETESHGQAVLMVDSIVDQRQFVIKSLEAHYQPVVGVAGATILGDGMVALILDVDALVASDFDQTAAARVAA
ncbi:chemotaxis protein CheA [Sphingobium subterraneum]|uniref:Chemotaxis protein CheA n=1 Tax=Sphingobium subterraneum TaxID=627688 RepID=A0A841IXV4_9SPHN|nr:chemotaxis protein CheA [Sphingobium subterraneum]MBB6123493.1 two-component system chemotaxis sensor kinase CheA [Sphingobium subterraneum]